MNTVLIIVTLIIGAAIGLAIGYFAKIKALNKKAEEIIKEAEEKAEIIKKNKLLEAKQKYLELKAELDKKIKQDTERLNNKEHKLLQLENTLTQKKEEFQKKLMQFEIKKKEVAALKENLTKQIEIVEQKRQELEQIYKEQVEKLETIAGMSKEEAKQQLIESLKEEAKADAMAHIAQIVEEAKLNAKEQARNIVIKAIQRVGSEVAANNSISVFHIESDEIKGRIIGREGRNIRTLEQHTGVDIIVDDTPEAIVLSSFDPFRREVARLALQQLVADGRIHPARIEEIVQKTKKQLEEEIFEIGKRVCIDLGIHGMHPNLMKVIGKMKYRSSYGQNLLQHSIETAKLAALLASELGLNPKLAKRAALLHDIGKVPEEDTDLPHAIYGMKLAQKYGEKEEVVNAIGAHHNEVEMTSLIAPIVQIADAISGARPGARREIYESYIRRLEDLERIALSFKGVSKSYAIQAGRELRVIVGSDMVNDDELEVLSYEIAKRIEEELTYPGQIKVTVIREKRSVSFAK